MILIFILVIFLGMAGCSSSLRVLTEQQSKQLLEKEVIKTIRVQYLLYLPEHYEKSEKKWPLMLFLHGAGERGDDFEKIKVHGPPKLIERGDKFPFIIVSPQCPANQWWSTNTLDVLLKDITSRYNVDEDRIYVTGLSMGGYGTWALAFQYPNRFAAIAPICGGGKPEVAGLIKNLPVWVFHGAKDEVVLLEKSQEMVDALKVVGGNVKFTIYPEAGHDSWTETYDNPELYKWFLKYKKTM